MTRPRPWPIGRAIAWIQFRDPDAHPINVDDGFTTLGYPVPWLDFAAVDIETIYVRAKNPGGEVVLLQRISTNRAGRDVESTAFGRLALECVEGKVKAIGRAKNGPKERIEPDEWFGERSLSDPASHHWHEVWLDEADMLKAFPALAGAAVDRSPETHSGMQGRPRNPATNYYEAEARRRHDEGEAKEVASDEASILFEWLRQKHPEIAPGGERTLANNIRIWRRKWPSTK